MTRTVTLDRATALATEARSLSLDGRVVEAEQAMRMIDELVGYWHAGRWCWPAPVMQSWDPTRHYTSGHPAPTEVQS